jgi:multiple sugar transport system substrate-binding protein
MTITLNFSQMVHNSELSQYLNKVLPVYEKKQAVRFAKHEITYEQGRTEFVNNAIYGGKFDVSEMGSTWINGFIAMNALRPYQEFSERIGRLDNYPPAMLSACSDTQGILYAIPWMTDVSMVYYRRDLFQKAGIAEEGAFASPQRFIETLEALADAGIESPWAMPTSRSFVSIHELFVWLQSSGYGYLDSTGRRVVLADPGPREILRSYLSLHKYLPERTGRFLSDDADRLFMDGKAAVRISGAWLPMYCQPEVRENIGMAIPMNQTYLGGAGLVVWNTSRHPDEALRLVEALMERDQSIKLAQIAGMLPARIEDIYHLPPTYIDPKYHVMLETAIRGSVSIPSTPLAGMVEDRLVTMLEMLWQRFFDSQADDLDRFLDDELRSVVQRLNMVLSNY